MQRLFLVSLAGFALAVGIAVSAPARPLYEPPAPPKPPPPRLVMNLNGTVWQGKYNLANRIYTFEPDGTVSYKSSPVTKVSIKNRGHWRLDGDMFYFDHNIGANKMMEFRGKITGPDTIVGEQHMLKTGQKTPVTMQRTAP
jgi:hypothetical protein